MKFRIKNCGIFIADETLWSCLKFFGLKLNDIPDYETFQDYSWEEK